MEKTRRQLTLFVDESLSGPIEAVRQRFNPVQYALIKSHVTLCREDEIEPIEQFLPNLACLAWAGITLEFGPAVRFSAGHGVWLPVVDGHSAFQSLREQVLAGSAGRVSTHEPHLTLMHPRNSACTDAIFEEIGRFALPRLITFDAIGLIEQEHGGAWRVLQTFLTNA